MKTPRERVHDLLRRQTARAPWTCPYCEGIRALLPSAKACPECNHLMVGDTCEACYGQGCGGNVTVAPTEVISPKRLLEQQQQEQVDADYERRDKLPKEPSYNSIADEIALYRPHPTARGE